MNAVVLGNGGSGKAAAQLLRREGWHVAVLEGSDAWPQGIWHLCVTSPGVPLNHPWQNEARANGVSIISELHLGAEHYRALGGKMLAVTGSKGKSSVVKLVADALDGIPCGNYGKPLCEVVLDLLDGVEGTDPSKPKGSVFRNEGTDPKNTGNNRKLPIAVVEISSFQMETTELTSDAFEAAAILNLQEDHLDRHGSVEKYHALKRKLLTFASIKIKGTDPEKDGKWSGLFAGSYFDNPILRSNGLCAVALLKAVGLDDDAIKTAFMRFKALPHRMQTIGVFNGVTWVDDSKATSLSALAAGVETAYLRICSDVEGCCKSVPKIRLIAGGLAKGDDPALVRNSLINKVVKVYLIGQCASMLADAWKDFISYEICGTMDVAVDRAKKDSIDGECVLLSPGTASYDQFKDYAERGRVFSALAKMI